MPEESHLCEDKPKVSDTELTLPDGQKLCRYCAQPIVQTATVCHHCSRHQHRFWQHFRIEQIGLLISFIMVVIASSQLKEAQEQRVAAADALARAKQAEHTAVSAAESAKIITAFNISLVKRIGRMSTLYSRREQEDILRSIRDLWTRLKIAPQEQAQLLTEWHEWTAFDYTAMIRNSLQLTDALRQNAEVNSLYRGPEGMPTPKDFEDILGRYTLLTPETRELLEDYKYYLEHHEHRRPNVWLGN
jgi:hypothetical protein